MNDVAFKKTNTALAVLLTNVTFGVYVPYWFISRRNSIDRLGKVPVNFNWLKFLFRHLCISRILFYYRRRIPYRNGYGFCRYI